MLAYLVAFGIANSKAKKEFGWNTQLLLTMGIFPLAIPFMLLIEIHTFINKKCSF
jgi:hypothetical protein